MTEPTVCKTEPSTLEKTAKFMGDFRTIWSALAIISVIAYNGLVWAADTRYFKVDDAKKQKSEIVQKIQSESIKLTVKADRVATQSEQVHKEIKQSIEEIRKEQLKQNELKVRQDYIRDEISEIKASQKDLRSEMMKNFDDLKSLLTKP